MDSDDFEDEPEDVVDAESRVIWQKAIDYFFEKTRDYAASWSEERMEVEEDEYEDGEGVIWRMCYLKCREREFRISFVPPFETARFETRLGINPERFAGAPLELLDICHEFGVGLTWSQEESADTGQTILYLVTSVFWSGYNRETFENALRLLDMCAGEIEERFV